jgi:hypothetical protein
MDTDGGPHLCKSTTDIKNTTSNNVIADGFLSRLSETLLHRTRKGDYYEQHYQRNFSTE